MSGTGNYAELIEKRFDIACRRYGLNGHGAGRAPRRARLHALSGRLAIGGQLMLF